MYNYYSKDTFIRSGINVGNIPNLLNLAFYSTCDDDTGFDYLSRNNMRWSQGSSIVNTEGPFSIDNSAFTTTQYTYLGQYLMSPKLDLSSFSLSFYLKISGRETIGVYQDDQDSQSPYPTRFSILTAGLNLVIQVFNSSATTATEASNVISAYKFTNALKSNEWTFVTLVYDSTDKTLKFYDEAANKREVKTGVNIDQVDTGRIVLGQARGNGDYTYFSPSSATTTRCPKLTLPF